MEILLRMGSDDMYQLLFLILVIILMGLGMIIIYNLMERSILLGLLSILLIVGCWFGLYKYNDSMSERTHIGPISLSQVSDKVHVDGSKVIIDELPKNIIYAFDGTNGRKVFEYSYDEKYEVGKLKTASGNTLELTHKDTELLRSLGAK